MTEQVNWSYAVQVSGGPTLVGAGMRPVDGYVKLSLTVPAHGTQSIEVMPGAGGAVQVLVIAPAKPSDKLTYQLDGNDVPLDGPHVLARSKQQHLCRVYRARPARTGSRHAADRDWQGFPARQPDRRGVARHYPQTLPSWHRQMRFEPSAPTFHRPGETRRPTPIS